MQVIGVIEEYDKQNENTFDESEDGQDCRRKCRRHERTLRKRRLRLCRSCLQSRSQNVQSKNVSGSGGDQHRGKAAEHRANAPKHLDVCSGTRIPKRLQPSPRCSFMSTQPSKRLHHVLNSKTVLNSLALSFRENTFYGKQSQHSAAVCRINFIQLYICDV